MGSKIEPSNSTTHLSLAKFCEKMIVWIAPEGALQFNTKMKLEVLSVNFTAAYLQD